MILSLRGLNRRWLPVCLYVLMLTIAIPYMPSLIQKTSSRWPEVSFADLLLVAEILLGALLIVVAGGMFFFNRTKLIKFSLIVCGSTGAGYLLYLNTRNPYELTHLPEYALLSILIGVALKGEEEACTEEVNREEAKKDMERKWTREQSKSSNLYLRSVAVACAIGILDEIYQALLPTRFFNWYDIFFNCLGSILGGAVLWGMSKK